MLRGVVKSREVSRVHGRRDGRLRIGLSAGLVAVLAGALVAGGREPQREVLATAATQPGSSTSTTSTLPPADPVTLPTPHGRAVRAPASVASPTALPGVPAVGSIPEPALVAYQRSAAVIDAADPSCNLTWPLLAAIGQIESDQGQVGGSHLNAQGVAHPPIIGPRLDGENGTSLVRDTDAGRLDGDTRFDHAVGPMQFLPSTWAAVAVDGDNNGRRDVQDIDDASLGSAVYLCANHDDLGTKAGAQAALLRYNHSTAYVAEVLAIAKGLQSSALFTSVTTRNISFTDLGQATTPVTDPTRHGRQGHQHTSTGSHPRHWWADPPMTSGPPTGHHSGGPGPSGPPTTGPTDPPTTGPTDPPTTDPTDPPTTDPTDPPTTDPTDPPTTDPTDPPTDQPPIIPDPLPEELAGFTDDEVQAYDAAWVVCRPDVSDTWADDADQTATLRSCLADQMGIPPDDPGLATFLTWVAVYEQKNGDPSAG
jgi:hypothetical protein